MDNISMCYVTLGNPIHGNLPWVDKLGVSIPFNCMLSLYFSKKIYLLNFFFKFSIGFVTLNIVIPVHMVLEALP